MGCDIHAYVEYEDRGRFNLFADLQRMDRDYAVFGVLAGVRTDRLEHITPRGVPENIGWRVQDAYVLRVDDKYAKEEDYCSTEEAERWIKNGSSTWWDADHTAITHPDWHTASWLTPDEYEAALNRVVALDRPWGMSNVYWAALDAMRRLEGARIVFWFDN